MLRYAGEDVARTVSDPDQTTLVIDKQLEVAEVPPSILGACLDLLLRLRRAGRIGFSGMEPWIVSSPIGAPTAGAESEPGREVLPSGRTGSITGRSLQS